MEELIYAGVGSRETPIWACGLETQIALELAKYAKLRSGHADGSDIAFENGCCTGNGSKEIYIPCKGFNGSDSELYHVSREALEVAKKFHPAWNRLSWAAQQLMGRNSYQVLGQDLKTPIHFLLCWTKGGKGNGGTGQAIRIAKYYNIPILDFGKYDENMAWSVAKKLLEDIKAEFGASQK